MSDTQHEARRSINANTLRKKCLEIISESRGLTADEATVAGASLLAIRPRVSELRDLGVVVDSGLRRRNRSGRRAIVWRTN